MRAAVLTVSTSVANRNSEDLAGPLLARLIEESGFEVDAMEVVADDESLVEDRLHHYVDSGYELVTTTGGTGLARDDVTPEATIAVIERPVPGLSEAMRAQTLKHTRHAMLSRAVAGVAGDTLIINFPGSPRAVEQCFAAIADVLGHATVVIGGGGRAAHDDAGD